MKMPLKNSLYPASYDKPYLPPHEQEQTTQARAMGVYGEDSTLGN